MVNNITRALEEFETLVKDGKLSSFWVSFRNNGLCLQGCQSGLEQLVPLEPDMYESLHTFFYDAGRIAYNSHDYTNLKCFINARVMLDRLLNKEGSL
ncbi:hypothetical protein GCM10027443_06680 [Pontibacter brevis]